MNVHEEAEANAAYANAEHMKFLYPRKPSTRSGQFAAYMDECMDGFPESVKVPFWIGCVYRWLDHPMVGEEELFLDAAEELERLSVARA